MNIFQVRMTPAHLKTSSLTLEERVTHLMERTAVYNNQNAAIQGARQYRYLSNAMSNSNAQSVKDKAAWSNSQYENPLDLNNQPGLSHAAISR